jgi:hypothetical protein
MSANGHMLGMAKAKGPQALLRPFRDENSDMQFYLSGRGSSR